MTLDSEASAALMWLQAHGYRVLVTENSVMVHDGALVVGVRPDQLAGHVEWLKQLEEENDERNEFGQSLGQARTTQSD